MTDLALIVPVCILLVKLVDRLIDIVVRQLSKDSFFTKEDKNNLIEIKSDLRVCKTQIQSLEDLHSIRDDNGIPLWYVPRGLETSLIEVVNINGKISHSQDDISKTLEKVATVLEGIDKKQTIIEFRMTNLGKKE
jgi:hypothetical protein